MVKKMMITALRDISSLATAENLTNNYTNKSMVQSPNRRILTDDKVWFWNKTSFNPTKSKLFADFFWDFNPSLSSPWIPLFRVELKEVVL